MKKLVVLIISLLVTMNSYAPLNTDNKSDLERVEAIVAYDHDEDILNYNLVALKDGTRRTRKEVFRLVQPVIDVYLRRHNWRVMFPNMKDSASYAIACIYISESSNKKGHPAESSLWVRHNNPFGLTASQGVTKKSWELINHKRVVMNRTFRTFDSFEAAIESLIWDYLIRRRFDIVRDSGSVKEFLYNLYKGGYMTNYGWPKFAYREIYLKCI